jgi:hypothetical protein
LKISVLIKIQIRVCAVYPFHSRKIAFPRERCRGQKYNGWALPRIDISITKKLPPKKNYEKLGLIHKGCFSAPGCKIKPESIEINHLQTSMYIVMYIIIYV